MHGEASRRNVGKSYVEVVAGPRKPQDREFFNGLESAMSWWPIYSKRTISSEKNGSLNVVTWFGKTAVIGGGVFQSGRYMQAVFRGMLRMLPRRFTPKRVLVVGLGAGGCVPIIQKRFPYAHIVALEYDEVMLDLAKATYLKDGKKGTVEIILGDIQKTLPRLSMEFDLILVDVFCGAKVAPVLRTQEVLEALNRLLCWRGVLLVNLFRERENVSKAIEDFFSVHAVKRILYNDIGLYRHYGMGKLGEAVPVGYEDREQSRMYLQALNPLPSRHQMIEEDGMVGMRMHVGSVVVDRFVQRSEPTLNPAGHVRIISWQPYEGTTFAGWWRIPDPFACHFMKGIAILENPEYWKEWSSHAKRHRKKFLEDEQYEIVEVDLQTFAQAYHATKFLGPVTRRTFIRVLRYHLASHPEHVHLTVARQRSDHRILSGLATIDYPDISQSTHVIAFIHPEAQGTSVGVGLIDEWFQRCLREKIRFLNFGILRGPKDPRSWQGYTDFKRQFHLREILYPRPVFRIIVPKRRVL